MEIILNSNDHGLSQGYFSLIRTIERSGVFEIKKQKMAVLPQKYWRKEEGFCLASVGGTTIAFDANGGYYNIESIYKDGLFKSIFKNVKVIIKTQFHPHRFWDRFQKETGIKVMSWIMWSTLNFPMECFKWNPSKSFKHVASCAGGPHSSRRWGRPPYIEWCRRNGGYHMNRVHVDEYAKIMQQCQWGLILQGGNKYNCDGKNTREVELSSCGMPLVLNYIPNYEYNFIPNKHFIYLESPEDLKRLETEDPRPYAKASLELWDKHLCPKAACEDLIRLLNV